MNPIKEHLLLREGVDGEFWPETGIRQDGNYSRGLWRYVNENWIPIITEQGDVKHDSNLTNNKFNQEVVDETRLFRVVNRNQFRLSQDKEALIHISPLHHTTRYNKDLLMRFLHSVASDTKDGLRRHQLNFEEQINVISRSIDKAFSKPKTVVNVRGVGKMTFHQAKIAYILSGNTEEFQTQITQCLTALPDALLQLIYIYNGYLGSIYNPMFEFGYREYFFSPDLLNLYCNVRAFTPEWCLNSVLNYILFPVVFRNQDIYNRGASLHDYVIIEIPFKSKLLELGLMEKTDYGKLSSAINNIIRNINNLSIEKNSIQCTNKYISKTHREKQLIDWLWVWKDVFQEVRLKADFVIPNKVYNIDFLKSNICPLVSRDGPCPICTRFKVGDVIYDVTKNSTFGGAAALFGNTINNVDEIQKKLFMHIKPYQAQIGYSGGQNVFCLS